MSDDEGASRIPSRMIGKKRKRAAALRDIYYRQAMDNGISDELLKELASVSLEYWSILREFRNEPAIDADDFPDMTPIRERIGQEVNVVKTKNTLGGGWTSKSAPAVTELDPQYLVEVTHALDDLSQKLGFGASAVDEVEVFGVDPDQAERDPE